MCAAVSHEKSVYAQINTKLSATDNNSNFVTVLIKF